MRGCCRQGCATLCAPVGSDAIPWSSVSRMCMCGPVTVADTCNEKSALLSVLPAKVPHVCPSLLINADSRWELCGRPGLGGQ